MLNIKNRFNSLSPLQRNIFLGISAVFATAGFGLAGIKYVVEPLNKSWQYATSQQPIKATIKVSSKEAMNGHIKVCDQQRTCLLLLGADVGKVYESIPNDRPIEISGDASRISYLSGVKAINSPIIRANGETLWGPPAF